MKKLVLALTAVAAFTGSASAADLGARPYAKAPVPVAPAYNWTGFYIFGGGGGGLWAADQSVQATGANIPLTIDQRQGGSGWFGTVGIGYDWQFNGPLGRRRVRGRPVRQHQGHSSGPDRSGWTGSEKTGGRVGGWCAGRLPGSAERSVLREWWLLRFSLVGHDVSRTLAGHPAGAHTDSFNRNGWFIGGGVENNLNIFGITAPGWFMKTEYRSAFYDRKSID